MQKNTILYEPSNRLDPRKFGDVVSSSSGGSFGFNKFYNLVLEDKFESPTYGYSLQQAWKDMAVVEELEKDLKMKLRVIKATRNLYSEALRQGHGHLSKGAMLKVVEQEAGVQVGQVHPPTECKRDSESRTKGTEDSE